MRSVLSLIVTALIPFILHTAVSAKEEESPWTHHRGQQRLQNLLSGGKAPKWSTIHHKQQQDDPEFPAWMQVGQTLIGSQEQPIGEMVKLSADGHSGLAEATAMDTYGLGLPPTSSTFTVNVHTYSKMLYQWIPFGDPIVITHHDGNYHAWAMDFIMSKDGYGTVAISDVQISEEPDVVTGTVQIWSTEVIFSGRGSVTVQWVKLPGDLSYGVNTTAFGASLALSSSSTIAVAAPTILDDPNSQSSVLVYWQDWDDFDFKWEALGSPIVSSLPLFGMFLKISDDGSIVVATGGQNNEAQPDCQVQAFQFDDATQDWLQMGQTFPSLDEEKDGFICVGLDLSGDGQTLVVGGTARMDDFSGGHVRVYSFDKTTKQWVPKGQDLDTIEERHSDTFLFGTSPQISANGKNVVVGLVESDQFGMKSSESILTYHYSLSKKKWISQGSPLDGQTGGSNAISLSDNGKSLVVGASGGAEYMGVVKTYNKELTAVDGEGVSVSTEVF